MENGIEMQQQNTKWTAQQIVDMIIAKIGIPITSRGQHNDSGEYWSGIKQEVLFDDRIGTHIEYHATFANRHPPIPQLNRKQLEMQRRTDKAKRRHTVYTSYTFYSLVIEDDNQQSQGNPNCSRKIVINRCYLKASQVTPENIDTIAADYKTVIQNANASECKLLKFSPIESIVENKKIKTESRNMNKNRIRLTESQLHRVIKESVKKVLKEMDAYKPDPTYWYDNPNLTDDDIERIEKEHQMNKDWDKIDAEYRMVHNMNYARNYDNDRLLSDTEGTRWMPDGMLGIAAQDDEDPKYQQFAKSFKGNAVKDTPYKDNEFNRKAKTQQWMLNYPYVPTQVPDNIDESIRKAIRKVLR